MKSQTRARPSSRGVAVNRTIRWSWWMFAAAPACLFGCPPSAIQQPDQRGPAVSERSVTTLDAKVPATHATDAASLDARNRPHAKIVDISQCDAFDTLPFTFVAEAEMPTCGNLSPPLTMQQLCGFARKLKSIKVLEVSL